MKLFVFLTLFALAAAAPVTMDLDPEFLSTLANPTHYGNPATGCESDEVQVQVQGVSGDMCAPSCSLFKRCPTDVPSGVSAKPQCALQDSATNKKYCALLCTPGSDGGACGGGSCQSISGVGICTYGNSTTATSTVGVSATHNAEWAVWKVAFGKEYDTAEEEAKRFGIWAENKLLVKAHNAAEHGWTMAMNKFADQTTEEFNSWAMGLKTPPAYASTGKPFVREVSLRGSDDPPTSVDWRSKGHVVNAVKNQQQCGSCWAFSTIASLETQYAIKNGNLTSFSEQDLVDCVKGVQGCCDGCQGGLMDAAFTYLVQSQSGNDDTESAYPYTQTNGKCKFTENGPAFGGIKSHTTITQGDESALLTAVANVGVISIGVDASKGWQMYSGGVYSPYPGPFGFFSCSNKPDKMDHGVAVVGYNTDNGKDYWIVRNSWGPTWGNQGYMYLIRGKNACGIANSAAYPVLA